MWPMAAWLPYGSGSGYVKPFDCDVGDGMCEGECQPTLPMWGLPVMLPERGGFAGGSRVDGRP